MPALSGGITKEYVVLALAKWKADDTKLTTKEKDDILNLASYVISKYAKDSKRLDSVQYQKEASKAEIKELREETAKNAKLIHNLLDGKNLDDHKDLRTQYRAFCLLERMFAL